MACIRPSLETGNYIITRGKIVNNFAFAFITPLQTQNYINHKKFKLLTAGKNKLKKRNRGLYFFTVEKSRIEKHINCNLVIAKMKRIWNERDYVRTLTIIII